MTEAGWILISERLPKDNTPVLTCDEDDCIRVLKRIPPDADGEDRMNGHVYWTNGYVEYSESMLIAWMPLPAPYREE